MDARTIDYHTAGEPFRIVLDGVPEIEGATVVAKRAFAQGSEAVDAVRRLLCHEPRGHADMYGCFLVEPDDAGADLGVLFWHKDGYSTACGHGTIALVTWAIETGVVEGPRVVVDVPSGRLETWARAEEGKVRSVRSRMATSSLRRASPRSSGLSLWRRRDSRMVSVARTPTSALMRASSISSQASSSRWSRERSRHQSRSRADSA